MANNPYKPEDKVLTKIKGTEVEAVVRLVWNDEVQVRAPHGLIWRTAKTVRPLTSEAAPPAAEPVLPQVSGEVQPGASASEPVPSPSGPPAQAVASEPSPEPPPAEVTTPDLSAATPDTQSGVEQTAPASTPEPARVIACGIEPVAKKPRKRHRK